jgi:3-hydroxyacyl-CoA dehydrogenase/enoyl-CoA hydratase/3-hydroxybutyryl-CoA epimerase
MPTLTNWRFDVDLEGIGWLTIDTPNSPVNTLSRLAITELETVLLRVEDLIASREVIGLVIQSGKDSGFIAGADVSEFDQMSDPAVLPEALKRAHAVMDRIETM